MPRKISSEVKIMNLFVTLSDEGRRIVGDWIKSQTATPRKASTKKAKKDTPILTGLGNESAV